jgi:hypothetical protein
MAGHTPIPTENNERMSGDPDPVHRRETGGTDVYRIRVRCHLSERWSEWFEGLTVTNLQNGEALLSGPLPDQAALLGILERLNALNVPLVSVNPYETAEPGKDPGYTSAERCQERKE